MVKRELFTQLIMYSPKFESMNIFVILCKYIFEGKIKHYCVLSWNHVLVTAPNSGGFSKALGK